MTNTFIHQLPPSRLGEAHPSLKSFQDTIAHTVDRTKEYTLVVVTAPPRRILLGLKNRGFGTGKYNSFGGKFDSPTETPEECASRELHEETNIFIEPTQMRNSKVGIQRFTFDKDPVEMLVHLFHIHLPSDNIAFQDIRPCEEITPRWFDDWWTIPLDNMFADDSLWLVALLSSKDPLCIDGSYHFQANGTETNTILHYTMNVRPRPKYTLEQRLFHAIHDNKIHSPSLKEFKECFAFQNIVRAAFKKPSKAEWDIVIDVAGGHGALAALFLICTSATKAVVVDPAIVGQGGVEKAWKSFWSNKTLEYRSECLRTGLPAELEKSLARTTPDRILVVACHACQHLSEETLDIASRYGVHASVMPCCQKDLSRGAIWKSASKNLGLPIGTVMDLLLAGKQMASPRYDVRMKLMDPAITPQNRIIICRAVDPMLQEKSRNDSVASAHARLESAYRKAHGKKRPNLTEANFSSAAPILYLALGFAVGTILSASATRSQKAST